MPHNQQYQLTLDILFSTEKDLDYAITIFRSWCKSQHGSHKQHGFIRTGQLLGYLFLNSSEQTLTWTIHPLVSALELSGLVHVTKSRSSKISKHPHPTH